MPSGLEHRLGPMKKIGVGKTHLITTKWMKISKKNVQPELPCKQKISTDSGI